MPSFLISSKVMSPESMAKTTPPDAKDLPLVLLLLKKDTREISLLMEQGNDSLFYISDYFWKGIRRENLASKKRSSVFYLVIWENCWQLLED